jgi:hypothetical protein
LKEPLNNYKSKDRKKRRDWDREIKRTIEIEDNIFAVVGKTLARTTLRIILRYELFRYSGRVESGGANTENLSSQ